MLTLRVDVQPETDSTPGCETLRSRWRDRRAVNRCHPGQWLLWGEIWASARVSGERHSQVGPTLTAEIATFADASPEFLGRVSSAARLAERNWMIRAQLEEHRPESDE